MSADASAMATRIYAHSMKIIQYTIDAITLRVPYAKLCMTVTQLACHKARIHETIPVAGIGIKIPGWVKKTISKAVQPVYITL